MTQVSPHELEMERGVWISEQWLQEAGLGQRIQVVIRPREIRILEVAGKEEQEQPSGQGWQLLRGLGLDAEPGRLSNAAAEHDRYLYTKNR